VVPPYELAHVLLDVRAVSVSVELGLFLLMMLGAVAPIGVMVKVAAHTNVNEPGFGVAMLGFCCTLVFWAGVIGTLIGFFRLSKQARSIVIVLAVGAAIIGSVALGGK
ncbi:MAG: hypothetical protein ACRDJ3_09640, partial [Solirubrobacteraceae bacterium]